MMMMPEVETLELASLICHNSCATVTNILLEVPQNTY